MATHHNHQRTAELLQKIEDAHDWLEGQRRSDGGTRLYSTDVCRICGLQRHFLSDEQNGNHGGYTFRDAQGHDLTLREAAQEEC